MKDMSRRFFWIETVNLFLAVLLPLLSDANALMVHISHLREKIEEDPKRPKYIFNIRGKGYSFGKAQK